MEVGVLIVRLALAAVFFVAAVGKLADVDGSRRTVEGFGLSARLARPLGLLLPLVELAIVVALIPVATAPWAALVAAGLLAVFCAAIVRVLVRGESPDCNCFGSLGSAPVGRGTLVRNGVLIAMAGFVTIAGWNDGGASAWAWIGDLSAVGLVALGLAAVTAAHIGFSLQLFDQNGRLLDRVSDLEAGIGSPHGSDASRGLPIGEPAPAFELPDLDGRVVALAELLAPGRGVLLVFTDPACGHCNPLLPALGRAHVAATPVAVISTGSERDNRANAEEHGIAQILLQEGFEVAEAYRVFGAPGAVLVDATGRIAGERVGGANAVATLLEKTTSASPQPFEELADRRGALAEVGER